MAGEMDTEELRVAVYRSLATTGQAARTADLCELLVVMAHPFATIPMGFSVMGTSTLWWGGCAWDAFALPHLLPEQSPVLVATRCPNCTRPLAWSVGNEEPPSGDEVAHFLAPAAHDKGYVMDLTTLWRLASDWYTGRLDYGYQRREPSRAAAYMRSAGLQGPFWGL